MGNGVNEGIKWELTNLGISVISVIFTTPGPERIGDAPS